MYRSGKDPGPDWVGVLSALSDTVAKIGYPDKYLLSGYPCIFMMPRYSDTVDREEDLNNLGDGGSPNGSPFARLRPHQTSAVQIKDWSQDLSEGLSLIFYPYSVCSI